MPSHTGNAWFQSSRFRAVQPFPLQKYVGITFIRKNSVAYVKNNVSVSVSLPVSSPLPFIRSYRIEFYFSVLLLLLEATRLVLRPPGPAALQAPAATAERPVYGHGMARHNGTVTATAERHGNVNLETRRNSLDTLRHPTSDAYSAQQILLNTQQIWCGGAYLDCYHKQTVMLITRAAVDRLPSRQVL